MDCRAPGEILGGVPPRAGLRLSGPTCHSRGPVKIVRKVDDDGYECVVTMEDNELLAARVHWFRLTEVGAANYFDTTRAALRAELTESPALHQELTEGGEGNGE